jgi:hypothetical protein
MELMSVLQVGKTVGIEVGSNDGKLVGLKDGIEVGSDDGKLVGFIDQEC